MSKKDLNERSDELRSDVYDWLRRSFGSSSKKERSDDGVVVVELEEGGKMFGDVDEVVNDLVV